MSETDKLRLLLRQKYGLVHVPNYHRAVEWAARTRDSVRRGDDPELAGLDAARQLFPYELKENRAAAGAPVAEILGLGEA